MNLTNVFWKMVMYL